MTTRNYHLPEAILNVEQVKFFADVFSSAVLVTRAPFGDVSRFNTFRELASRVDEVFGEGATVAARDGAYTGWLGYGEATAEALIMIFELRNMADADTYLAFFTAQDRYNSYYQDIMSYVIQYGLEEYSNA